MTDLRGAGSDKRREWEREVNAYQNELARTFEDWASELANDLAGSDEEYDEILDAALLVLVGDLSDLGASNITKGAILGLGNTAPTPAYLGSLSSRLEANEGYIEASLLPDIRTAMLPAQFDALDAAALLALLVTFGGRVESYSGAMWTAMQEAQGVTAQEAQEAGEGGRVEWMLEEGAAHCDDCTDFAGVYDSWDEMMVTTGGRLPGEVECSANCRCSLWVEVGDEWTREGFASKAKGDTMDSERLMTILEKMAEQKHGDVHVHLPAINMPEGFRLEVPAPEVTVNVAAPPPAQVNVTTPAVNVTVPDVNVTNVQPDVHVHVPPAPAEKLGKTVMDVERDEDGNITRIIKR